MQNFLENTCQQNFEIQIDALVSDGRGVGRYKNQVVFVEQAIPGQKVHVHVVGQNKKYLEAKILSVLTPSRYERPELCAHAQDCGGCSWQHLEYQQQLYWKKDIVASALARIGHIKDFTCLNTIGSPQEWHYRNKMEFVFAYSEDFCGISLGLHMHRSHKVIPIKQCFLQPKYIMPILDAVRQWVASEGLSVKDVSSPKGYCRFLVVRTSKPGKCLVELIVNPTQENNYVDEVALCKRFSQHLQKTISYISGVILSRRSAISDIAYGETLVWHEGDYFLQETIGHIDVTVKYDTFFQVNTTAAEILYSAIKDFVSLTGKENVWDLYTGVGSIGLFLAPFAQSVLGIDVVPSSIEMAKYNAKQLGYNNCSFEVGSMQSFMKKRPERYPKPQVVVVDPPRSGLDSITKKNICSLAPRKCVYISCNPGTLARDIAFLSSSFKLIKTQPIDLFPQTPHVETVSLLELK